MPAQPAGVSWVVTLNKPITNGSTPISIPSSGIWEKYSSVSFHDAINTENMFTDIFCIVIAYITAVIRRVINYFQCSNGNQ
jgi:hypothetical protein